jgi:hypothetical protein
MLLVSTNARGEGRALDEVKVAVGFIVGGVVVVLGGAAAVDRAGGGGNKAVTKRA